MLSGILDKGSALIIYDSAVRCYLTDFKSSFGVFIYYSGESIFLTDNRYIESAEKCVKNAEVHLFTEDFIKEYIAKNRIKKVGLMLAADSAKTYLEYVNMGLKVTDITDSVFQKTAIKGENAQKTIQKACIIAEKALKLTLGEIQAGITEKQLSNILEANIIRLGGDDKSFDTIVAFGKNSSVPHHQTGGAALGDNMPVLIDFGARVNGFCSDMTRTFYFGTPTDEFKDAYFAVLDAHNAAAENIKSGMVGRQADAISRDLLNSRGYGEYFTHSLGHGIGLNIHEWPYLNKKSTDILLDDTVFSIEPGVYLKGKFGIRIEDTVRLISGSVKSFMTAEKELLYIENNKFKTIKR